MMPSFRVAVFLTIFAGGFGASGAWLGWELKRYFDAAETVDSGTERLHHRLDVGKRNPEAPARPFGYEPAVVVKDTSRADIVIVAVEDPKIPPLHRRMLEYVAERNPNAAMRAFRDYPAVVLDEAARTNIDHCLLLAQAQAESDFRPDAVGTAGEIGLYQIMPSTAKLFEPYLGRFRRPTLRRHERDLGDLAEPVVSTRFAMAYLRDILARKPSLRDALTEYNGGPRGRQPHYYRIVMATYVEILERPELRCRLREFREIRPRPRLLALAPR